MSTGGFSDHSITGSARGVTTTLWCDACALSALRLLRPFGLCKFRLARCGLRGTEGVTPSGIKPAWRQKAATEWPPRAYTRNTVAHVKKRTCARRFLRGGFCHTFLVSGGFIVSGGDATHVYLRLSTYLMVCCSCFSFM